MFANTSEAYTPVATATPAAWEGVGFISIYYVFVIEVMECTGTSYNYNSCQMIGGEDVVRFQSNGYYEEVE